MSNLSITVCRSVRPIFLDEPDEWIFPDIVPDDWGLPDEIPIGEPLFPIPIGNPGAGGGDTGTPDGTGTGGPDIDSTTPPFGTPQVDPDDITEKDPPPEIPPVTLPFGPPVFDPDSIPEDGSAPTIGSVPVPELGPAEVIGAPGVAGAAAAGTASRIGPSVGSAGLSDPHKGPISVRKS